MRQVITCTAFPLIVIMLSYIVDSFIPGVKCFIACSKKVIVTAQPLRPANVSYRHQAPPQAHASICMNLYMIVFA